MPDHAEERRQQMKEKEAEKLKLKGNSCMANRDYEAALQNYTAAVKLSPDGPNSHVYYSNRAAALCYLERYEEAEADSEHSLLLVPDYGKAHARLGLSRFFMGDYSGAIDAYTSALRYDPENAASKSYLAKARARLAKQSESHHHSSSSRPVKKVDEKPVTQGSSSPPDSKDSFDEIMNSGVTPKNDIVAEI
jgi:small glutamine-rich tetratricopeptide repeat-containing protein alpha